MLSIWYNNAEHARDNDTQYLCGKLLYINEQLISHKGPQSRLRPAGFYLMGGGGRRHGLRLPISAALTWARDQHEMYLVHVLAYNIHILRLGVSRRATYISANIHIR